MRQRLIAGVVALSVGISGPVAAQSSGQLLKGGAIGPLMPTERATTPAMSR